MTSLYSTVIREDLLEQRFLQGVMPSFTPAASFIVCCGHELLAVVTILMYVVHRLTWDIQDATS